MHVIDVDFAVDGPLLPSEDDIRGWVRHALLAAEQNADCEVAVRVVGSDEIQALNNAYRQRDKPTNVLSFPAAAMAGLPADAVKVLGDIAVCASVVEAEAETQGKVTRDHWAHLLIHGTLHLLGYDHETDAEAEAMEAREVRLLAALGISNPYIA